MTLPLTKALVNVTLSDQGTTSTGTASVGNKQAADLGVVTLTISTDSMVSASALVG